MLWFNLLFFFGSMILVASDTLGYLENGDVDIPNFAGIFNSPIAVKGVFPGLDNQPRVALLYQNDGGEQIVFTTSTNGVNFSQTVSIPNAVTGQDSLGAFMDAATTAQGGMYIAWLTPSSSNTRLNIALFDGNNVVNSLELYPTATQASPTFCRTPTAPPGFDTLSILYQTSSTKIAYHYKQLTGNGWGPQQIIGNSVVTLGEIDCAQVKSSAATTTTVASFRASTGNSVPCYMYTTTTWTTIGNGCTDQNFGVQLNTVTSRPSMIAVSATTAYTFYRGLGTGATGMYYMTWDSINNKFVTQGALVSSVPPSAQLLGRSAPTTLVFTIPNQSAAVFSYWASGGDNVGESRIYYGINSAWLQ